MKIRWDLGLFYKSANDPKIERDLRLIERACANFGKRYKNSESYLKTASGLAKALGDYEKLIALLDGARPLLYFHYLLDLKRPNDEAEAAFNRISQRVTAAHNHVLFFELAIGQLGKNTQKKFLAGPHLAKYKYFLQKIFKLSAHDLSEAEEKIMNLKSLPSRSLWMDGAEKLLNRQFVLFKNKKIPLATALAVYKDYPTRERRELYAATMKVLKDISHFAESEINAIYLNKKIDDELRGFREPYEGTILHYENEPKAILALTGAVTKGFKISRRFFNLKAKLHKLPHLFYADRAAGLGKINRKFKFADSLKILRTAFNRANPEFGAILDRLVLAGQVDVYPGIGKHAGAYCSHSIGGPTFVLLNHTDDLNSLRTFGHEMGHAIHSEFSKSQSPIYQNYTIAAAEVASTLFENFIFEEIFEKLSDREKVIALHDRISGEISTVFRQIACFNFELDLHRKIRAKGALSGEEIAALHNKHMASYMGPKTKFTADDGYFFVYWSHIRRFFYVYSYAYGNLISSALYRRVKKDPAYMSQINKFLRAGGSRSPEQIFKDIGIDTSDPGFFAEGLKKIEDDIKRLEVLTKKFKF